MPPCSKSFGGLMLTCLLTSVVLLFSSSVRAGPGGDHVAVTYIYLLHSSDFTLLNPAEPWAAPAKVIASGERPGTLVAAVVPEKIEVIRFMQPCGQVPRALPAGRTALSIYRAVSHAPPEKKLNVSS